MSAPIRRETVIVSVIIPVYNAEKWLDECLQSVYEQDFTEAYEVSIFNDSSRDKTVDIIEKWTKKLEDKGVHVILGSHSSQSPRGVGYAKNQAIQQSHGTYLCFLDADDVMCSERISRQYKAALGNPNAIIGSQFHRDPPESTEHYTRWANTLTPEQLYTQIYTSHGPTVIMPTWFCSRRVVSQMGGFDEGGKGTPEDLIFFFQHLELGGHLYRVDEDLLMYRYHQEAATFSVHENTIWNVRMEYIQKNVIDQWETFTIWNAGKQGKKFYRSLKAGNQKKVKAFCDVDVKKIQRGYYEHYESKEKPKPRVPIMSYKEAEGPFVICVKLDMSDGVLEGLIHSLKLVEGKDYYHFS